MAAKRKTVCNCPRCGYEKATPNAQGPDHVHCRKCGGLVPVRSDDELEIYSDDPVRNLIDKESDKRAQRTGAARGVLKTGRVLRGGL